METFDVGLIRTSEEHLRIMRSQLEQDFRTFLTNVGIKSVYEPEDLCPKWLRYFPDFYLIDLGVVVELRGYQSDRNITQFANLVRGGLQNPYVFSRTSWLRYFVAGPVHCSLVQPLRGQLPSESLEATALLVRCKECSHFLLGRRDGEHVCGQCRTANGTNSEHWTFRFDPDVSRLFLVDGVGTIKNVANFRPQS